MASMLSPEAGAHEVTGALAGRRRRGLVVRARGRLAKSGALEAGMAPGKLRRHPRSIEYRHAP